MDYFRTQYEKFYEGDEYFWGLEPAPFLDKLLKLTEKDLKDVKVLDLGCGEGKDAVYMAEQGCQVSAFDITETGIKKTKLLAEKRNVEINAFVADINNFEIKDSFDILYSTGTIQYLFDENIAPFFKKLKEITNIGGIVYLNVFVDKPFMELPPDWDKEEKMWKTGQLFTYFEDWEILDISETIFECNSCGIPHYHCMDNIIAKRRV